MRIVGLDLSLTSTGVSTWDGSNYTTQAVRPGKLRDHARLYWILDQLREHTQGASLVVVEGPAFGAKGSAYHQLAGLWWLVTYQLWLWQLQVAVASPAAVKQYATGKGNAQKDVVLAAVVRRFAQFSGGNDEADALILAALGAEHVGFPILPMPQTHIAALKRVEWPTPSGALL